MVFLETLVFLLLQTVCLVKAVYLGPTKERPGMPENARRDVLNARECPGVGKECPELYLVHS